MRTAVDVSVVLAAVIFGLAECVDVTTCPAKSPDLNKCLKKVLQDLAPLLGKGIPSIGAEPTDPLRGLPDFEYSRGNGLVPFTVHTESNYLKGLASVQVDDVQADLKANKIRIKSSVSGGPEVNGIHHTIGDIFGFKLRGSGPYKVIFDTAVMDLTLQGEPTEGPDGKTYLQLNSAKVGLKFDSPTAVVDGFFSSFPPLEKAAAAFADAYAGQVVDELKPTLEKWLEGIAMQRAQAVFSTVPYDELFPGRTYARG